MKSIRLRWKGKEIFCQVTTKGCVTILLMIACFAELPSELNWLLWDVLHWIIKVILNHKLFQSCNTQDYESISPKLQFGELNHIVAEYHYKCNSKIRFYFHILEFADYTYSLFFLEYVSCVVLFVLKCVKLVFINFFQF